MRKYSIILSVLILTIALAGCASKPADGNETPRPLLSDIVGEILTQGAWEGKEVTIVGNYRGWDLLHEAEGAPPVTRSDWVIKDNSGAIYVYQAGTEIKGLERLADGESLSPGDKASVNHILRVVGFVRMTEDNQSFIEAKKIELVR